MSQKKQPRHGKNTLELEKREDQDQAEALAEAALHPSLHAILSLREYGKGFGDLTIDGLYKALQAQMDQTAKGNLGRGEAMLTAQAHTLDAIFNSLAQRAVNAEYISQMDTYLKLALRAQSQCRATWETLSTI